MTTTFDDGLRVFPRSLFGTPKRIFFEGIEANAPEDTPLFLRLMYGDDYLTPPPPDQRKTHFHDFCDLNTPYANYQPT